jgi:hypothetical protein
MLRGTQRWAEASAWIRYRIGKVKPIRYVVVTCLQMREREGHRDVEAAGHAHKRSLKIGVGVANHHPEKLSTPPEFFTRPNFTL